MPWHFEQVAGESCHLRCDAWQCLSPKFELNLRPVWCPSRNGRSEDLALFGCKNDSPRISPCDTLWFGLSSGNIAHKSGWITSGRALCLGLDSDRRWLMHVWIWNVPQRNKFFMRPCSWHVVPPIFATRGGLDHLQHSSRFHWRHGMVTTGDGMVITYNCWLWVSCAHQNQLQKVMSRVRYVVCMCVCIQCCAVIVIVYHKVLQLVGCPATALLDINVIWVGCLELMLLRGLLSVAQLLGHESVRGSVI